MGNRDFSVLLFLVALLFYSIPFKHCLTLHNITQYKSLQVGDSLLSSGEVFELGFFSPKSSTSRYLGIWYRETSPETVVWLANRDTPLRNSDSQSTLTIGSDGNLELFDGNNISVWSTKLNIVTNDSVATLSDNGNLILNDGKSGVELWQSIDQPSDTLLPGGVVGFDLRANKSYVLTSWKSDSDPSSGNFVTGISSQNPPEAFIWVNGSVPYWRSGPWEKSRFTGIPEMNSGYLSAFDVRKDVEKGTTYMHFSPYENSSLANLYISSGGVVKIMERDRSGGLFTDWEAPRGKCDFYGVCGPFGVCRDFESPICTCLKGFEPKIRQEWDKGNWTGGCTRRLQLSCGSNKSGHSPEKAKKDGFFKISHVKLPDLYELVRDEYIEPDGCGEWCMDNCSCLAYAYVNGIGCLLWSEAFLDIQGFPSAGNDLLVRLAREELEGGGNKKNLIIGVVCAFSFLIIGCLVFGMFRWKAKEKGYTKEIAKHNVLSHACDNSTDTLQFSKQNDLTELLTFDFSAILSATNNFSEGNKLGKGGFGSVYKGILQDGKEIAVKRLASSSGQGVQEFQNEVILISKLQHRNLVKLLGYCVEKEEKLLVLELMPNKSLDYFLFDPIRSAQLDWAARFNIIQSVGRGLVYLHRDSCLRVIHRDLKASNILLDEKMNPKISDFGLARIFEGTLDLASTQRVVGTLGYMSPEYAMGGIFSEKSDVFSFGILILEIVSGKKNTNFYYYNQQTSLIAFAWQLWSENKELEFVDRAVTGSYSESEAKRSIHVGILCVQDHAGDRPSMPEVLFMLCNETNCPEPKRPIFTLQSSSKSDQFSQPHSRLTVNEATMSFIEGR